MSEPQGPRQKIIENIKDSSNILVAVSKNPNVDELAAAIGLTLMLNELNKHPTAIASGRLPAAISFLDPEGTFEDTVDSLRDFIIALDKEKADHLRYKVEGDVVKIFITPYRTTISDADLEFTQGDYNVELVLALGVKSQDDLDEALSSHGKIFHDATVASLSVGSEKSGLGDINWHEAGASSISEMLVSVTEALSNDETLITEQVATAYLTGIVAATDRFSNDLTSSKVMTIAAQLMAAGANQQLIALKLQEGSAISGDANDDTKDDGSDSDSSDAPTGDVASEDQESNTAPGTLSISHEKSGDIDEVAKQTIIEQQVEATDRAEDELAKHLESVAPAVSSSKAAINKQIEEESNAEPALGGTLNATTDQAEEANRREEASSQNKTILSHGQVGGHAAIERPPTFTSPLNAATQNDPSEPPTVDIFAEAKPSSTLNTLPPSQVSAQAPPVQPLGQQANDLSSGSESQPVTLPEVPQPAPEGSFETLSDIERKNRSSMHSDAQAAVDAAFANPQTPPATSQASVEQVTQPALPPLPEFGTPSLPPSEPPLPDFSNMPQPALPPLPQFGPPSATDLNPQLSQILAPPPQVPLPPSVPADPGQFKIPGQ